MTAHILQSRRERVSRLLSLAMLDRNHFKACQARYLLQQINSRILSETSLTNCYSNLI